MTTHFYEKTFVSHSPKGLLRCTSRTLSINTNPTGAIPNGTKKIVTACERLSRSQTYWIGTLDFRTSDSTPMLSDAPVGAGRSGRFPMESDTPCRPQRSRRTVLNRRSGFRIVGLLVIFASIFFCPPIRQGLSADSVIKEWKELKGEHFLVYFIQDEKFAKEVVDKSEGYYRRIAVDLGYPRYNAFWLWENRVKIYIYPDRASFTKATNQPQWSEGMADFRKKMIAGHAGIEGFLDSVLPHEIAHLIFRDFVGFQGEIPLWLDEGVAQWSEEKKRQEMKSYVQNLYNNDTLLSVADMMKLDVRYFSDKKSVFIRAGRTKENDPGVILLTGDQLVNSYYAESVSLVGFLIEKYGSDRFAEFCRQLRDGKKMDEALRFSYPTYIRSIKEFEDRWREYLANGS